jgi:hypothetical protein
MVLDRPELRKLAARFGVAGRRHPLLQRRGLSGMPQRGRTSRQEQPGKVADFIGINSIRLQVLVVTNSFRNLSKLVGLNL